MNGYHFVVMKMMGFGHSRVSKKVGGFTLLEVLVAMMILAISLVSIMQLFSGGLKSGKVSEEYTRGIFHAREKIEEILLAEKIAAGKLEGEFGDGFSWKADILLCEDGKGENDAKTPVDIFHIKVDVTWHEGKHEKHFEINTLKTIERPKG